MDVLFLDLCYAFRSLRRSPGFTFVAVLTLALAIGANTAIFSVVRAVVLRPLPYRDVDRLLMVWSGSKDSPEVRGLATPLKVLEWRARNKSFGDIAALELWSSNQSSQADFAGPDGPERLRGSFATPNFFDLLGVDAALGRTFTSHDVDVVVLSDGLWRRRFGRDPRIIGHSVRLVTGTQYRDARPYTIVGILPPAFRFTYPKDTELWLSMPWQQVERATSRALLYTAVARLRPNVTRELADADMANVTSVVARTVPYLKDSLVRLEPIQDYAVGQARPAMRLLVGVTIFVLLIGCADVASLLLARNPARTGELAVRSALGAGRGRLVRQLLSEATVTVVAGGAVGTWLAATLEPALRSIIPATVPRIDEIRVDSVTFGWSLAAIAVTIGLAAAVPSWMGSAIDVQKTLRLSGSTTTGSGPTTRWRRGLTAVQVCIVFVLVVSGGLLLRSFWNLERVDLGFDGTRVLTMEMRLLNPRYRDAHQLRTFQADLLDRVRAVPGVTEASITSSIPFRGVDQMSVIADRAGGQFFANKRQIDPGYFEVMHIPVIAGRAFTNGDTASSPPVSVISESLARAMFPNVNPIGQSLGIAKPTLIVGVVGDVRHVRVDQAARAAYYTPRSQDPSQLICLVVRTATTQAQIAAAIRTAIGSIDAEQPVEGITTLDRIVSDSIADRRFYALATIGFALLALALSIAGLYGVLSRGVAERSREIGLRLALGAGSRDIVTLVLGEGMRYVFVGIALGAVAAFWSTQLLQRFLFDVTARDAGTYIAAAILIAASAAASCVLPTRRALSADPMIALRTE